VRRLAVGAALLGALALLPAASGASPSVRWFHSPSRNIECEVAWHDSRGTYAYCQTDAPPRSVTLHANGTLKTCTGGRCIGNGPEGAFTLAYGTSTSVGEFRCTSLRAGMRCVVPSGRGFLLARAGITRL